MIKDLGWHSLQERRAMSRLTLMYKLQESAWPSRWGSIWSRKQWTCNQTIDKSAPLQEHYGKQDWTAVESSFFPCTVPEWNNLPGHLTVPTQLRLSRPNWHKRLALRPWSLVATATTIEMTADPLCHISLVGALHRTQCRSWTKIFGRGPTWPSEWNLGGTENFWNFHSWNCWKCTSVCMEPQQCWYLYVQFEACQTFMAMQTDATLLANNTQQCWELMALVASVCMGLLHIPPVQGYCLTIKNLGWIQITQISVATCS